MESLATLAREAGFNGAALTILGVLLAQWAATVLQVRELVRLHKHCPEAAKLRITLTKE